MFSGASLIWRRDRLLHHIPMHVVYVPAMRNLTDDMLKAIAKTGGLVGMNSMREFISEKHDEQNVEHLADHVEYIADLIGIDHIGLGFDFDDYLGGEALKTFSDHVDSPSGDGISMRQKQRISWQY